MPSPPIVEPSLEDARLLLQGYNSFEWPDLSATRRPFDDIHTSRHELPVTHSDRVAQVILAISRIIGSYCGTSDVLLAVELLNSDMLIFVRVLWRASDTCSDIIAQIDQQMTQLPNCPITLPALQRILDLSNQQWPCVALCRFSTRASGAPHEFPLTFTYNASTSEISLQSSAKNIHPSVATQLLSQVAFLAVRFETESSTSISPVNLPSELMSVYERTRDSKSLAIAYPHLLPVELATDYLTRRSITDPNSVAVCWYPDLSPESLSRNVESISYIELHQNANKVARWLRRMGLKSEDRVAVCMARNINFHIAMIGIMRAGGCYVPATVAFDVHLAESFVPIALGMPLISAPRSQLLENLPSHAQRLRITHMGIVPSLIEATMGVMQEDGGDSMALRYIASGGEKMSDAILDKWANHSKVRLANFYGPSEATIGCCARYMDRTTPRANIGRAFANVSAYVVDADLNVLPRGAVGELVIEGPLVGRGYHGRPDLTGKVFMEWPQKGNWAYRTGDLVRMMPDQTLEIIGRIDTQIKLRGVRIESEGISSIIRKAAPASSNFSLDATTVLAKHPSIGTEQLVSFIAWDLSVPVATRKSQLPRIVLPPKDLIERIKYVCEAELARYMRPNHIIPLSWFPLSPNGKSDIKALVGIFNALHVETLAALMAGRHEQGSESRPATKLEKDIFGVLGRHTTITLSVALPGLNIFECGIDSMSVIRFAKDLKETLGYRISASDIMSSPTLAGIASFLTDMSPSSSLMDTSALHLKNFSKKWFKEIESNYIPSSVECLLPSFSIQEGVLSRSIEHDTMYVQHVVLSCKNNLSLSNLKRAWGTVASKHPIMRTVFYFSSALVQVVLRPTYSTLPWAEEITKIGDSREFACWFLDTKSQDIARVINTSLSHTPAFRLHAYLSPGPSFIVLSIHHALYDGISLPLLINDVEREYHGLSLRTVPNVSDILDQIASTDLTKAREFWVDHFRGFAWPSSLPRTSASSRTIYRTSRMGSSLSSLKDLAASQQVTLQALLTCAFAVFAATKVYHTSDISFGIIRSGRLIPVDHVENAICPLVSVIPTRVNLTDDDVLQQVQLGVSAMVAVEHVPLGKLQGWIRPGKPLFDLLFSVSVKPEMSSDIWEIVESQLPEADYPLAAEIVLDVDHDSVMIQTAWKEDEIQDSLIQNLINEFEAIALDVGAGKLTWHLTNGRVPSPEIHSDDELYVEPEGSSDPELLLELRTVISKFLDINKLLISEDTSLISLGLDSIKCVGLSRILKGLGYSMPAVEIMKHPSLRKLSSHIASRCNEPLGVDYRQVFSQTLSTIRRSFSQEDLKLSPSDTVQLFSTTSLQAGMLSHTLNSKGVLYIHAFPLKISTEKVILDRLKAAWIQAIDAFDILRTSFHFNSNLGVWAQAVHSENVTDWTSDTFVTSEDYQSKLSAYLASIRPVDENSFRSPPIWLRLFKPAPSSLEKTYRLVIVMHHALYDGVSLGILFDAVQAIYRGNVVESPTQFTSLLDHLMFEEESGASFWIRALNGFNPTYIPVQGDDCPSQVASRTFTCEPTLLMHALQHSAVTVQCLGQLAWGKVLSDLSGSFDVVFGHNVSGRSIPGADRVIGPVLNTIPCRLRLRADKSNAELLRSIHDFNVEALPWQHASLRLIQKRLCISRLWDSLFVFQPLQMKQDIEDPLWTFDIQENPEVQVQYAISIELHQLETGFTVNAASKPGYMSAGNLDTLLERFQFALKNVISHPDAPSVEDISTQPSTSHIIPPPASDHSSQPQNATTIPELIQSLLASITNIPASQFTSTTPLVALGIDSITAIQIVTQFRRADMILTVNDIISCRTLGEMIARIRPSDDYNINYMAKQAVIEIPIKERDSILARLDAPNLVEAIHPASSGMKWLVGSWQRSERTAFQHAFAYRLPTDVNIQRLRNAWISLQERLILLRSTFASAKGSRELRIVTFRPNSYPENWTEDQCEDNMVLDHVIARMKQFVESPPSTKWPPSKAAVYRSSKETILIIYLNHFQFDAWSVPLIIDDLSRLYLGQEFGTSNNTAAFLQVSGPTSDNLEVQKRYWMSLFPQKFQPVLLPPFLPPSPPTFDRTIYTTKTAVFGAVLCEERARQLEVSLPAVFLACWAQVQGKLSSSNDITIGLWQAGRSGLLDGISQLASPCSNIVPMYVRGLDNNCVVAIAQGIQEDLRARSATILQSDLIKIDEWVDAGGKPLTNVVVNIVRVAPEGKSGEILMKQLDFPYYIPPPAAAELEPTLDRLATTELVQASFYTSFYFAVVPESDTILMSIDAAANFIDNHKATEIVKQWGDAVRDALGIE
ncbi:NRPS protein [Sphagnurus paluster]|uniref:NRPS protein n=1 Tax=Sphagnurus paluster TaxID=117069 RepID=A0A9P7GLY6_9AGAR|nr:NRPS protein [Sphagnurus paluster]